MKKRQARRVAYEFVNDAGASVRIRFTKASKNRMFSLTYCLIWGDRGEIGSPTWGDARKKPSKRSIGVARTRTVYPSRC